MTMCFMSSLISLPTGNVQHMRRNHSLEELIVLLRNAEESIQPNLCCVCQDFYPRLYAYCNNIVIT
jgi:hypothetical protein